MRLVAILTRLGLGQVNLDMMKSVKFVIYFVVLKIRYIEIRHLACKNISEVGSFLFDSDGRITGVNARQKLCLLTGKIAVTFL